MKYLFLLNLHNFHLHTWKFNLKNVFKIESESLCFISSQDNTFNSSVLLATGFFFAERILKGHDYNVERSAFFPSFTIGTLGRKITFCGTQTGWKQTQELFDLERKLQDFNFCRILIWFRNNSLDVGSALRMFNFRTRWTND